MVVVVHRADRRGLEFSARCGRSACFSARAKPDVFPNLTKAFSTWLPLNERSRAQGFMWTFAPLGRRVHASSRDLHVSPHELAMGLRLLRRARPGVDVFLPALVPRPPRRQSFRQRSGAGAAGRSAAEMPPAHVDVPWEKLLRNRSLWLLWIQYFCLSFPWYFYITWLPTYLQEYRHQSPEAASRLAILPLLFGGFGALVCGLIMPWLSRKLGSLTMGRRTSPLSDSLRGGELLFLSTRIENACPGHSASGAGELLPTIWTCRRPGTPAWIWAENMRAPSPGP